jgi:hypothetical protein
VCTDFHPVNLVLQLLALTVLRVQSHEASQGPPLSGLLLVALQPYPDNCPTPPAWVEHWHFPMKARSLSDVRTDKRISAHAQANPRRSFPPSFFILLLLLHLLQPPTPTALLLHPSWVPQHKWLLLTSFDIALVQVSSVCSCRRWTDVCSHLANRFVVVGEFWIQPRPYI